MNPVELVVVVILLLMVVPDLCARLGRPALTLVVYLAVGVLMGPILAPQAMDLLSGVREFGFILLLFGIGLEIDIPRKHHMFEALGAAGRLSVAQLPLAVVAARCAGLEWPEAFLVGLGLSACSLGLIVPALRAHPSLTGECVRRVIQTAMVIEIGAVLLLAAGEVALERGVGLALLVRACGIVAVLVVLIHGADRLINGLHPLIQRVSHWRGHILALFVLLVAATGERLGLSAAKTAFFLGLFITRATHERMELQKHLAPFGERLLIPLFMVSLGALISPHMMVSRLGVLAILTSALLIGMRVLLVWQVLPGLARKREALLFCPNLTIVAVTAYALSSHLSRSATEWSLACSLFMSLVPLVFMPATAVQRKEENGSTQSGCLDQER